MKTTVIFHSADMDGIFCREIARHFLGDKDVEYIGWNFGDPALSYPEPELGMFYLLDLPCDQPFGQKFSADAPILSSRKGWEHFVWIDHHKTSIETHPAAIPGYRIDGVAACRLAWQWFATFNNARNPLGLPSGIQAPLPDKQAFLDRKVSEPLAVRLAGEYDVWDKRDPDAETFQYGLHSAGFLHWRWNSDDFLVDAYTQSVVERGKVARAYAQNVDASICNSVTWLMEWEGLKWLCVNHARFNSLFFAAKDVPETGHDALLGFRFDGKNWLVSMYHARHRTDLDLSTIAVKHGGGGHRGSAGFTCKQLPFSLG